MRQETFGKIVKAERVNRGWTVKQFTGKLEPALGKKLSPAYITRIEQYDEIPSPDLLCLIADVLKLDIEKLMVLARATKVRRFDKSLEEKYREAVGLHRVQKKSEG
ncbi:MAG: helix-turn-helix domain-containing protein [candidate division Zixibacteria bacterium]|nr:helix-turn-helix domain-containing protein [candidate division Zixibacteria bacterium]MDH3938946.1 helix-turn-helix domain-containing protein [candidate division Zixibacteria bacterium]MDH4032606.1 helix-turn-helix domain-containing protein [candidate division Zixibacteria bacterium]